MYCGVIAPDDYRHDHAQPKRSALPALPGCEKAWLDAGDLGIELLHAYTIKETLRSLADSSLTSQVNAAENWPVAVDRVRADVIQVQVLLSCWRSQVTGFTGPGA